MANAKFTGRHAGEIAAGVEAIVLIIMATNMSDELAEIKPSSRSMCSWTASRKLQRVAGDFCKGKQVETFEELYALLQMVLMA